MTEPVLGPSLLQAQDLHRHSSQHNRNTHHNHNHIRSHQKFHQRQDQSSDSTVEVVQTVAVVQLVDSAGATVGVLTQTSDPSTVVPTQSEATFVAESNPNDLTAIANDVSSIVSGLVPTSALLSIDTSATSMPSSFPTVESFAQVTSAPLSGSTAFPTFSGVTNSSTRAASTASSLFRNETASFKSLVVANLTTSTLLSSSGTVLFNASYTTTLGQSSTSATHTLSTTTATGTKDGGFVYGTGAGGTAGGATAPGTSTSTSTADAGSGTTPSQTPAATVAGSVLGAVAGIAFILVIALYLLRWKKRQNGLRLSDNDGPLGSASLIAGGGPSSGGSRGLGEMSQRRSVPFAIPGALASLTGYKRHSQQAIDHFPEGGAERSFQKISGRKLPSVLQHGGDGYSEPSNVRDSILSDGSHYRDSQGGYFGGPNMPRLALGSPMRPESGVPIFHPGPARTPVTEQGRFSPLEPPARDPLGRSLPSQDGSNRSQGSGSRFTEVI